MSRTDPLRDVLAFDLAPSGQVVVARITFATVSEKIAHCDAWATRDAPLFSPSPRFVARSIGERLARLRSIHDAIRLAVPYRTDDELHGECEAIGSPRYVAHVLEGDCDKHATLGAAMARAQGAAAELVALGGTPGEPDHLALAVAPDPAVLTRPAPWYGWTHDRELPAGWYWSETTIAIPFGAAPYEGAIMLR